MEQAYYELIKSGKKTIDQVPKRIKDEVQALLDADKKEE